MEGIDAVPVGEAEEPRRVEDRGLADRRAPLVALALIGAAGVARARSQLMQTHAGTKARRNLRRSVSACTRYLRTLL